MKKDLIERENWYKTQNTPVSMEESNTNSIMEGRIPKISWKRGKKRLQRVAGEKKEVKSVIFIPHTKGSELATQLRDKITGSYRRQSQNNRESRQKTGEQS